MGTRAEFGHSSVLLAVLILLSPFAQGAPLYEAVNLGNLGCGASSDFQAWDISNAGQVVGRSNQAGGCSERAFSWSATTGMTNLGLLPGGPGYSYATSVNEAGQVVGVSSSGLNNGAFIWDAVLGLRQLNDLGQNGSAALAINNSGTIVGESSGGRAVVWGNASATPIDIGLLGSSYQSATAFGINSLGQVIGFDNGAGVPNKGFIWDETNGLRDLGSLQPGGSTVARAINSAGQVVGTADGGAFIWDGQYGMRALAELTGASWSNAFDINDNGWIVGRLAYSTAVWLDDAVWSLDRFFSDARAINDLGQIVGTKDGNVILLNPCDTVSDTCRALDLSVSEPSTLALAPLALLGLWLSGSRRRRARP